MTEAKARAVVDDSRKFDKVTIKRRDVGPKDVLIEIKYAGICHSDIHTAYAEWGEVEYPLTPGHEIIGVVSEVGSEVTKHKVGDQVGVGCMVDSCRECEYCKQGDEQFCVEGAVQTYNSVNRYADGELTQGGYSSHIVVTEDFVLRIPDGVDPAKTTPLLCAGITTYSPLKHWDVKQGTKVAVVGLGGLGHVAVKIAHAMGAEVSVISHSDKKRQDSQTFGADHYYDTSQDGTMDELRNSFDLILNTVSSSSIDFNGLLGLLKVGGTMVNVGAPPEPVPVAMFSLIFGRKSLAGSLIGGIRETQEMLDFCAEHGITAEIEMIDADHIPEAYERVNNSDVRYRFVIDATTL